MARIDRPLYMNKLIDALGTPDIKVITGIRRSGKSVLLESLIDHIRATDPDANVIHVDFNLLDFEPLREYHALHAYVNERHVKGVANYVMIDEVQMCDGFEKTITSLHASGKYDLFITGSNAFLLSSDLATLFTGRTFEVEVMPFSLEEFARYFGLTDPDEAFDRYVLEGGMPGSYVYANEQARYRYLSDVLDMLVMRDIKQKHRVRNQEQLTRLCDFLMDNIGNVTSLHNVGNALAANGLNISDKTLAAYVNYLCAAFVFCKVRRYDISGKKYLASGDKYYLADPSFRYAKLGTKKLDYGHVYENMVALELMRRGWEVYVGVLYQKEIDFVAVKRGERLYVQVSDDISKPPTLERELEPLLKINDAYPKLLIARTKHEAVQHDGVQVLDLARWMMGE